MKLRSYYFATVVAAVLAFGWLAQTTPVRDWKSVLVLGAFAFLAETLAFQLPLSGSVSLGFALGFAALLYDGPVAASLVALVGSVSIQDVRDHRPVDVQLFNSAQLVLSILAASGVFLWLGGLPLAWAADQGFVSAAALSLGAALLAATAFFLVNIALVGEALALRAELPLAQVLREQSFVSYWISFLTLALLGFVLARVVDSAGWVGAVLLAAPFVIARKTFRVYLELSAAYADTVRSLVQALEAKDPYTRGHSERVAEYAKAIAGGLGLSVAQIERVEIAALLHDVGKIGIPEATLSKAGPLTAEEYAEIREHPAKGASVLLEVEFLAEAASTVAAHHERMDGTGYPMRLSADDIPLDARILAVADAYDAMTSSRPYRAALRHESAVQELVAVAGTQLDRLAVDALLSHLQSRGAVQES
jgi:putative nucleotidyltransferase with HDIG domain